MAARKSRSIRRFSPYRGKFEEAKHKRAPSGQFTFKPGGVSAPPVGVQPRGRMPLVAPAIPSKAKPADALDQVKGRWQDTMQIDPQEFHDELTRDLGYDADVTVIPESKGGGGVEMGIAIKDKAGNEVANAIRKFRRVNGVLYGEHSQFRVKKGMERKGIGKAFIRNSFRLYERLGVKQVSAFANVDVGGYAWAKYGFKMDESNFDIFRGEMQARLARLNLSPDQRQAVETILAKDDPRLPWMLADMDGIVRSNAVGGQDMKLGKALMMKSSWDAIIKLRDREAMQRLLDYTSPARSARRQEYRMATRTFAVVGRPDAPTYLFSVQGTETGDGTIEGDELRSIAQDKPLRSGIYEIKGDFESAVFVGDEIPYVE